ncbi:MAG: hypothetical protein KatS3mg105_1876 [Gemmatales bacterium]|nr:MAG: hypothetical protein KatS3mg105_1876 [Gemmatales bacterium]
MTRIFSTLAAVNGLLLVSAFAVGTVSKLAGSLRNPSDPTFMIHFWLGLAAAIVTLLVHCLIFTYFLGTGRWVKEVGLAYQLPDAVLPRQTRELKRSTFPPALAAMLVTIATAAAGSGAQMQAWPWQAHALLATLTLFVNFWAFRIEFLALKENAQIIDNVLVEVDRIRAKYGLPTNAEALRQEEAQRLN